MKNIFWAIAGIALIVVIIILSGKNADTATPIDNNDSTVNPDWVSTTSGGKSFSYPAELGTNYISLTQWPPILQIKNEMYSCVSAGAEIENAGATTEETVNGHKYCVTRISEGAAGSMYTEYFYARPAGTKTEVMTFTLRFVQCGNYNDPEKTKCELERNTFDIGDTVDRIFQTVK